MFPLLIENIKAIIGIYKWAQLIELKLVGSAFLVLLHPRLSHHMHTNNSTAFIFPNAIHDHSSFSYLHREVRSVKVLIQNYMLVGGEKAMKIILPFTHSLTR